MKPLFIFAFAAALAAPAQDNSPERVKVPFSDPSRPKTVKVSLINGGISVKGYNGNEVVIEASGEGRHRDRGGAPAGMHRIDVNPGLQAEESENVVTITTGMGSSSHLDIQVPVNTSLKLSTVNGGNIVVEGVSGEIDVNNTNGAVTLNHVSGSVVAHALNGKLTALLDKVTANKPMSFSSLNGNVDVTLPSDVKANVKLKTDNGEIYTDFDVKVDSSTRPLVEENRSGARYRVKLDKTVSGTINGGGPEIQFTTFNGNIYIRKAK